MTDFFNAINIDTVIIIIEILMLQNYLFFPKKKKEKGKQVRQVKLTTDYM